MKSDSRLYWRRQWPPPTALCTAFALAASSGHAVQGMAATSGPVQHDLVFRREAVHVEFSLQSPSLTWRIGSQEGRCRKSLPTPPFPGTWTCTVPEKAALGVQSVSLIASGQVSEAADSVTVLPETPEYVRKLPTSLDLVSGQTGGLQTLRPSNVGVSKRTVESFNEIVNNALQPSNNGLAPFDLRSRQVADGRVILTPDEAQIVREKFNVSGMTLPRIEGLHPLPVPALPIWKLPINQGVRNLRPLPPEALPPGAAALRELAGTLKRAQPDLLGELNPQQLTEALRRLSGVLPTRIFVPNERVAAFFRDQANQVRNFDICRASFAVPIFSGQTVSSATALKALYANRGLPADIAPTKEPGTGVVLPLRLADHLKSEAEGSSINLAAVKALEGIRPTVVAPENGSAPPASAQVGAKTQPIVFVIDTFGEHESRAGRRVDVYERKGKDDVIIYGHGEHIARIIKLMFGVPDTEMNYIPACDQDGSCRTPAVIQGICQAIVARRETGRPVIVNLSLSTPVPGEYLKEAVELAASEGVMMVAAHGNGTSLRNDEYDCRELGPLDRCHHFPADWSVGSGVTAQYVLSVAALEAEQAASEWTAFKYGRVALAGGINTTPDVLAPGTFYFPSLKPQETVGLKRLPFWGTSFAAPVVTGLLAQRMSLGDLQKPPEWKAGFDLTRPR